jgi:ribonuclease HII
MSWESPINLITNYTDEIVKSLQAAQEECVMRAVANVGVYVEKDELLKALAYDRNQYTIGWNDGYNDRDKEIIRCKDCVRRDICRTTNIWAVPPRDDWFCADGKRRDDGD